MKRTIILAAFAVTVAVTFTGGAHAKTTLSASSERILACFLLELAEKGACVAQEASLIGGYVTDPSTNPDEVLGGRTVRPIIESLSR